MLSTAPTYVHQPYYPPAPEYAYDNTASNVNYNYQPFRNLETSNTEAYIAPQVVVTDARGQEQRSSYINEVSGQGRTYEAPLSRSRTKPGISTVRNSSKMNSYDDYGQAPVRQESNNERYDVSGADWRIQK